MRSAPGTHGSVFIGVKPVRGMFGDMAGTTGLEPATSAVTGQRSNQLNYVPRVVARTAGWWAVTDLNRGPSRCKRDALTAELTAPHASPS